MSIASIAESLTALENAKQDIADAITAKGGTVGDGDGYADFAEDVATIPSGGQSDSTIQFNEIAVIDIPLINSAEIFCDNDVIRHYTHSEIDITSDTTLTSQVACNVGDLVIALIATRSELSVSSGWTVISTSNVNSQDTTSQRIAWSYKYAASAEESITVTQTTANRIYINMIALPGTAVFEDLGYTYKDNTNSDEISVIKPSGLALLGMSASTWNTGELPRPWISDIYIPIEQLSDGKQQRLGLGVCQGREGNITLCEHSNSTITVGCLAITGIEKFYN